MGHIWSWLNTLRGRTPVRVKRSYRAQRRTRAEHEAFARTTADLRSWREQQRLRAAVAYEQAQDAVARAVGVGR